MKFTGNSILWTVPIAEQTVKTIDFYSDDVQIEMKGNFADLSLHFKSILEVVLSNSCHHLAECLKKNGIQSLFIFSAHIKKKQTRKGTWEALYHFKYGDQTFQWSNPFNTVWFMLEREGFNYDSFDRTNDRFYVLCQRLNYKQLPTIALSNSGISNQIFGRS